MEKTISFMLLILSFFSLPAITYTRNNPALEKTKIPSTADFGFNEAELMPNPPYRIKKYLFPEFKHIHQIKTDKIPGFDDVPEKKNNTHLMSNINLLLIPYLWDGIIDGSKEKILDHINNEMKAAIRSLKSDIKKRLHKNLIIKKMPSLSKKHLNKMNELYFIMSNSNLSKNDKMVLLNEKIMSPLDIHVIITIKHSLDSDSGIETLEPILIDRLNNKIHRKVLIQNQKEARYDSLNREVEKMLITALEESYQQ